LQQRDLTHYKARSAP